MVKTYFEVAVAVLQNASAPLSYREVWKAACDSGLDQELKSVGKTPWDTMGVQLYQSVRSGDGRILGVGKNPIRFWLGSRSAELESMTTAGVVAEHAPQGGQRARWKEKDLHALLAYFCGRHPGFRKGRSIQVRTIPHEKARKSGYSSWSFPDLVGVYYPFAEWESRVSSFARSSGEPAYQLFSFELKKALSKGNYRESFFQALSNSSWAHEAFLVTAAIDGDDDLHRELERLSAAFGVGLILLDVEDPDASHVRIAAKSRGVLDWDTLNKLALESPDFSDFLHTVEAAIASMRIQESDYDQIPLDIQEYVQSRGMADPPKDIAVSNNGDR